MKWLGGEMGQDDRHGCSGGWRTLRLFYGAGFAFGESRAGGADKWMSDAVMADEAFDPVIVSFFRADGVMVDAEAAADLIEGFMADLPGWVFPAYGGLASARLSRRN